MSQRCASIVSNAVVRTAVHPMWYVDACIAGNHLSCRPAAASSVCCELPTALESAGSMAEA
jgi:hypothetical protein